MMCTERGKCGQNQLATDSKTLFSGLFSPHLILIEQGKLISSPTSLQYQIKSFWRKRKMEYQSLNHFKSLDEFVEVPTWSTLCSLDLIIWRVSLSIFSFFLFFSCPLFSSNLYWWNIFQKSREIDSSVYLQNSFCVRSFAYRREVLQVFRHLGTFSLTGKDGEGEVLVDALT